MQSIKDEIEFTKALVDELPVTTNLDDGLMVSGQLTTAQGAGLRAFRSLLFSLDTHRSFGGLERVHTAAADILWVCPLHYRLYDPGFPALKSSSI
jgi:hypothetical protein